jgi:hypothetical protein
MMFTASSREVITASLYRLTHPFSAPPRSALVSSNCSVNSTTALFAIGTNVPVTLRKDQLPRVTVSIEFREFGAVQKIYRKGEEPKGKKDYAPKNDEYYQNKYVLHSIFIVH